MRFFIIIFPSPRAITVQCYSMVHPSFSHAKRGRKEVVDRPTLLLLLLLSDDDHVATTEPDRPIQNRISTVKEEEAFNFFF